MKSDATVLSLGLVRLVPAGNVPHGGVRPALTEIKSDECGVLPLGGKLAIVVCSTVICYQQDYRC